MKTPKGLKPLNDLNTCSFVPLRQARRWPVTFRYDRKTRRWSFAIVDSRLARVVYSADDLSLPDARILAREGVERFQKHGSK